MDVIKLRIDQLILVDKRNIKLLEVKKEQCKHVCAKEETQNFVRHILGKAAKALDEETETLIYQIERKEQLIAEVLDCKNDCEQSGTTAPNYKKD